MIPDDVKVLIPAVLAHRLVLTPDAQLRDETIGGVIDRIVHRVKVPLGMRAAARSAANQNHATFHTTRRQEQQ